MNGKTFILGAVDSTLNTFELKGSDTTASTGTLSATPTATAYAAGDMVTLCLSSITINKDAPGTISTATFCDPSASLPGAVTSAGTLEVSGYVDTTGADYQELLLAEADGLERILDIQLPNNGNIVAPVKFSSITWDLPIEGAIGWNGSASLVSSASTLILVFGP